MLNSALQNVEKLKARGAALNPLWIHPDHAGRLGLGPGDLAEITTEHATIRAPVRFDPTCVPAWWR